MANYVSGWKNPVFKIYQQIPVVNLVAIIELPMTGSEGLIETVEEKKIIHELTNYTFLEKVFGYRLTWALPYTEYAHKETMLRIQEILRYQKQGLKLVLIPRSDVPQRKFEVIYTGDKIDTGIKKGGINSIGNRLVRIQFTCKNLIEDINWIDPDTIPFVVWTEPWVFVV